MRLAKVGLLWAAVAAGGCDEKKPVIVPESSKPAPAVAPVAAPTPAAAPTAGGGDGAATTEAEAIFAGRCAPCHGPAGKGDGPAAASLRPPPRDYTDAKWQTETTDELIEKTIVNGGMAVGKSPLMPPNPDLGSKPAVVAALRKRIRSFGGK